MRQSEERKAFLLKLSDTIRPLADPVAIQEAASRLASEYLDIGRVAYCEVRYEPDVAVIVEGARSPRRRDRDTHRRHHLRGIRRRKRAAMPKLRCRSARNARHSC